MYPVQPILKKNFVSTGAATTFIIPSDAVKVEVYDLTNIATVAAAAAGAEPALFQKASSVLGMSSGSGYSSTNTVNTKTMVESLLAAQGFTFVNTQLNNPGPLTAITAVTNANPAVVSTANTFGLTANSSIVRMINVTGMQQISSLDFTVGTVVLNTSFSLAYLNAAGFAAPGTGGFFRIIPFDEPFYPRVRTITNITRAANAVVTLSVTHGFTVGQLIRVVVPANFGMTEINGLQATVIAVDLVNNTITLNIDSRSFTAFAFPTSAVASLGTSFPQIVPIGEAATAPYQNLLDDATRNTGFIGVTLDRAVVGAATDNMLLIAYSGLSF